ncbi:hypothetical protein DNU06_07890 [Putridiphycobacter roseus]|uniref:Outer membrane protein beta-barrel domain-containing protein n=1 Tax=Putridiphycobacter roseus TaxID=2219161 RepID=A0A2W1NCT0_9FLAO|nr:hypothetical protein [Putridiphycobacter roseus]PZE17185.1 hypothetical protein DNU06_07890 [Putridiphycobacter roseus]
MQNKINAILLLVFAILTQGTLQAQKLNNLSIALTNETYSFPFTRFLPLHPGLEIGTTLFQSKSGNSTHHINAYLGGYHHQKVENALYLRTAYSYQYNIKNTIGIDAPVGIGYQHTFYPGETYVQNTDTGAWENKKQWGKSHALLTFGLGLTYLKANRLQPFIRYESNIDLPLYNSYLTTRTFFKLGMHIKLN